MTLTISLESKFQTKLEQLAQSIGKSTEEVVVEAINEHIERLHEQRLEAEIWAFEQMYLELKTNYFDQFVALYGGKVIDSDSDFERLFLRVQAKFEDLPILIRQVGSTPIKEWQFRSPRLEHS